MRKDVEHKPVRLGDKRVRHSFRLYHDPSSAEEGTKDRALHKLLQEFVDQPMLLRCGPGYPDKLAIHHDGTCWIVYAEAEAEEA
jgi:hypothetical protein